MRIHLFAIALTTTACVNEHNVGNTPRELAPPRWAISLGGADQEKGIAVVVDAAGDVIAGGPFFGTVDFGSGPVTTKSIEAGLPSTWLSKRSGVDGSEVWTKTLGLGAHEAVELADLAVDNDRNVIAIGRYYGLPDFGGQQGNSKGNDLFIAKYSPNGNLAWMRGLGPWSDSFGTHVTVGSDDRIYVSGRWNGIIYGDTIIDADKIESYITAFDPDGTQRWFRRFAINGDMSFGGYGGFDLAMGSDGALVAVTTISDRSEIGSTSITPLADSTQVIARISTDGDVLSARARGKLGEATAGGALSVGDGDRMVLVSDTGTWDDTITVLMTDLDGNELWSQSSIRREAPIDDAVLLPDGTTVTTGAVLEASDALGEASLTATNYLRTFDDHGRVVGLRLFGDRFADDTWGTSLTALAASPAGLVAFTGSSGAPVDFGTGSPVVNHGQTDIVIGLIDPND